MNNSPLPLDDVRRQEVAELLALPSARAALAQYGTPLLLLDVERVRAQHRRLRAALPFVRFHYAVKALDHPAVIAAIAEDGGAFDVATTEELALVRRHGVTGDRILHTHPVKKPAEIAAARAAGVSTFVVDNVSELDKFVGLDARVLIRLAYRSPHARVDLSSKFGVAPDAAETLVRAALDRGIRVGGFSFHVGSQLDDPARFAEATAATLALMDRLESSLPVRLDMLDIGGGFPASYDQLVAPLETIADALRPLLAPRADDIDIVAEPGRVMVAESMTLVSSVVGIADRPDGRWYYVDDGVYGSYSNVVSEGVHPLVFAERDLVDAAASTRTAASTRATIAGPTCDSLDVIARDVALPDLAIGDLLVSPVMGAYTAVTASRFNGRPATPIAVVAASSSDVSQSDGAVEAVSSVTESGHDVPLLVEPLV